MRKIALASSIVTVLVSALLLKTTEPSGLFAIAWIGGLAYSFATLTEDLITQKQR